MLEMNSIARGGEGSVEVLNVRGGQRLVVLLQISSNTVSGACTVDLLVATNLPFWVAAAGVAF